MSPALESRWAFALPWPIESSKIDFLSHFINMPYTSPCSLEILAFGTQPPYCEKTQATAWRACIQVFGPAAPAEFLANSQYQQLDVWVKKPFDDSSPSLFSHSLWVLQLRSQTLPSWDKQFPFSELLTHRIHEHNKMLIVLCLYAYSALIHSGSVWNWVVSSFLAIINKHSEYAFLWGTYRGHRLWISLTLADNAKPFPKWLYQFRCPSAVHVTSSCSTPSPIFDTVGLF